MDYSEIENKILIDDFVISILKGRDRLFEANTKELIKEIEIQGEMRQEILKRMAKGE